MSTPTWYRRLTAVSDVLDSADREDVASWRGGDDSGPPEVPSGQDDEDVPPLTFRLAHLGAVFAERSAELTGEQVREVLGILEEVQATGSEYDRTAVATGFFEALMNAWDKGRDVRPLWEEMGRRSRAYCLAWNEFTGVPTPDWMR